MRYSGRAAGAVRRDMEGRGGAWDEMKGRTPGGGVEGNLNLLLNFIYLFIYLCFFLSSCLLA